MFYIKNHKYTKTFIRNNKKMLVCLPLRAVVLLKQQTFFYYFFFSKLVKTNCEKLVKLNLQITAEGLRAQGTGPRAKG